MVLNFINRALAQSSGSGSNPIGSSGSGSNPGGVITNPLANINSVNELILKILDLVVKIGLPVIALGIIYVGFLFVSARGNETEISKAKTAFLWVVIGAAIVLGAQLIAVGIQNTIQSL